MNILKYEVGNIVTRVERAVYPRVGDESYMGDKVVILRKGDKFCEVAFIDSYFRGDTKVFTGPWLEGWEKISDSTDDEDIFNEKVRSIFESHEPEGSCTQN